MELRFIKSCHVIVMWPDLQEAKMSQETLADQVTKTNEEKYNIIEKLEAANKVGVYLSMYTTMA